MYSPSIPKCQVFLYTTNFEKFMENILPPIPKRKKLQM